MESLLFSQNNLVWHLEIASECDNIAAVYNKLGKNGDPFRQFAWDILRYSVLDVAIHIKSIHMGVRVEQRPVPLTARPNIRFKVSQIHFVIMLLTIETLQSYDLFRTDWPAFLVKLLRSFDGLRGPDLHITNGESETVPTDGRSQGATTEPDTVMFFFRSLCDRMMKMGKNHVNVNFDLAAMHLAMVLQVSIFTSMEYLCFRDRFRASLCLILEKNYNQDSNGTSLVTSKSLSHSVLLSAMVRL